MKKRFIYIVFISIIFLLSINVSATTYKDYNSVNVINSDYSYSTVFVTENTEFKVLKSSGNETWLTNVLASGKSTPYFSNI